MEPRTLMIRGVEDRHVRDPITLRALPADRPTEVPDTSFWRRRLLDGDAVLDTPGRKAASRAAGEK